MRAKLSKSSKGSSVIGLAAAFIVLGLVGSTVLVFHHKQRTRSAHSTTPRATQVSDNKHANPPTSGSFISTPDSKISLTLPATWHVVSSPSNPDAKQVISTNTVTQICKGGVCGVAGCIDVDDPTACIYEAALQPKILGANDSTWDMTVEKTNWTIPTAAQSILGNLNAQNTVEQSSNPINGYDAFYVKVKPPTSSDEAYVDIHFFIEKDGYLVHFSNREQHTSGSQTWDYSRYTPDFLAIVKSIAINT